MSILNEIPDKSISWVRDSDIYLFPAYEPLDPCLRPAGATLRALSSYIDSEIEISLCTSKSPIDVLADQPFLLEGPFTCVWLVHKPDRMYSGKLYVIIHLASPGMHEPYVGVVGG